VFISTTRIPREKRLQEERKKNDKLQFPQTILLFLRLSPLFSKLASYASPPLSPKHWADLDPHRPVWDSLMDGDQRSKQHERLMARSINAASRGRGRATDRFEQAMHTRGDPTGISQAPDRAAMSYDYGYTGNSFPGGSLQPNDVQAFGTDYTRPRHAPHHASLGQPSQDPVQAHLAQHPDSTQQQQSRRRAPAETTPLVPYESAMLYGFNQQGSAHGPFDVVPQYSTRQSAAIEALSNQMAIPQYFAEEPTGSGVPGLSPYLNALAYNQPGSMVRPNNVHPFPTTMADFTPIGTGSSAQPVQQEQQQVGPSQQSETDPSSLEQAYAQYQRALRSTFDQTRAGRLVEASGSLLEISEWLVTNARDLGRFGSFLKSFFLGVSSLICLQCCAGEIKFYRGDLIVPSARCTDQIPQPTLDYLPFFDHMSLLLSTCVLISFFSFPVACRLASSDIFFFGWRGKMGKKRH
jgi:hypothetical protein